MDDLEKRRRARAAAGYSLKSREELAAETGIKYDRLRSFLGPNGRQTPTLDEVTALVDAAGLPKSFATDDQPEAATDIMRDVSELQAAVVGLNAQLAQQGRAIQELRGRDRLQQRPGGSARP